MAYNANGVTIQNVLIALNENLKTVIHGTSDPFSIGPDEKFKDVNLSEEQINLIIKTL